MCFSICDVRTSTILITADRSSVVVLSYVDIQCTISEDVYFGQYFTELFCRHTSCAADEPREAQARRSDRHLIM